MSVLRAKTRNALPDSAFALPGRRYPIHDLEHARNALSRVAQNGTPEERRKVRAAVARKFGDKIKAFRKHHHNTSVEDQKDVRLATDHSSSTHPWPKDKPGQNWIEKVGGRLPPFIKRVAKHIMADSGYSQSRAIAAAISQCKKGRLGPKGLAAAAQWEALKARAGKS
jgi:hypothetical protein